MCSSDLSFPELAIGGRYSQQLGGSSNLLLCSGGIIEWTGPLAENPNQPELPAELPGQTGPPACLCRWAEKLARISAWTLLQAEM